jgi:hypothetical protein
VPLRGPGKSCAEVISENRACLRPARTIEPAGFAKARGCTSRESATMMPKDPAANARVTTKDQPNVRSGQKMPGRLSE